MAEEQDIDVGAITEALNNKTDTDGYNVAPNFGAGIFNSGNVATVVEKGGDFNKWYRLWSDGWIERGGYVTGTGAYGVTTVTFLKSFSEIRFINGSIWWSYGNWYYDDFSAIAKAVTDVAGPVCDVTLTGFKIQSFSDHVWYSCGYVATT